MPSRIPVLCTTATANDRVVADIRATRSRPKVIRGSLDRESLSLSAIRMPTIVQRMAWLAQRIPQIAGSGSSTVSRSQTALA
jgi:ATP-dependent DNA helicase RecQ